MALPCVVLGANQAILGRLARDGWLDASHIDRQMRGKWVGDTANCME